MIPKCKYCGRPLRDKTSITKGYGKVCYYRHRPKVKSLLSEEKRANLIIQ